MSTVYFRRLGDHSVLAWFSIVDGEKVVDIDCNVGDSVELVWNITDEMASVINDHQLSFLHAPAYTDGLDWVVAIPFTVSKKRTLFGEPIGSSLPFLGYSIYLDAENITWEQILEWVLFDKRPAWVWRNDG